MGFYKNSKKTQQKLDDEEYKKYRETLLPFETAKYEALSADYNNIRKAYTDGSDGNYHDSAYYDSFKQHFNNLEERRKKLELDFKTNLTEDYSKNYLTALNNLSTDLYSLENHRKNKSYYFSQFKNDDSYTNFINTQKFDGKSFADVMAEYEKSDDKTKSWLDENKYNYMTLDELKTEKEKLSGKQNLKDKINNFSNKLYDKFGGDVNNTYRKKTNNQSYETSKNENTDDYYENKYKLRKINQLIQSKATEEKVDSLDNDTLSAIDKYNEATTKRKNANIGQFISVLAPNNAVNSYGNKNTDYINAHTEASKDMEMAIANIQNLHPDWNKSKIEELSYLRKQQLEAKESERFKNEVKEMTNKNPIMGAIWGRIANPVGGIASTAKTVKQLAENTINKKKYGFDYGVDPNSAIYAIKDSGQVADQTNMEKYNKEIKLFGKNGKTIDLYDLAYQVATGTADNLVRVGLAGGSSTGAGAIMLAQAFADGFTEKKKYGYSDKDAFISGSIQATIEGLTEKYSIETILDQKKAKSIFGALGKAFVAEGSEEVVGNLANRLVDLIDNGEYSEIVKNVRQYQKKGMSGNKALGQAFLDMIGEDTEAMVVGGLSGALMGAGYQINGSIQRGENKVKNKLDNINAIDLYRKNLIKDNAEYKAFAKQQGDENLFNNYDNALTKYKENTKNRKNKRELNSAAKDLAKSVRVNVSEQTKSVFNNTLKSELESAGVTEEQKNAVDKWINNKMLSEFDVSEINKLDENVLNNAVKKANGEMDYVSSKITMDAIKESKGKTVPNITAYHTVLDTPNSGTGAVIEYNGENVSINSFADVKQGKVNLNNGNTVNLSDVEMSSDTATIIEGVRSLADRYKLENDKATVLLTLAKDTIGTGVRADDIALALDDAFIYGTLGAEKFLNNSIFIKSTIKNPIVANAIKAAYDIGFNISNIVKSHDSDISAKIAVKKNFNNNKVKFEGGIENTLKSYSIEQRTEAAIINRLSKDIFSNDIVIFDSRKTENSKLKNKNGAFRSKDGSIWIDINAEQGLLGALSHELTHFMKSLNNAKFKEIANILIDEYGKARVPLEDVIKDYM
ncbi:MAG: hypothetical protein ACTTIO_04375, partial [Candidatus Fimenecus sp.]